MRVGRRRMAGGAMAVGVALGLALLGWLAPGELEAPAAEAKARVAHERRAPPPAPKARGRRVEATRATLAEEPPAVALAETDGTTGLLIVDVVDQEGRPAEDAIVQGVDCPGFRSGPPGEYRVEVGACTIRAARRDGALFARGPELTVVIGGPDETYAALELRGQRFGGIGIRFQPVGVGMQIIEVAPGTPAAKAGLQPGDVVVAIGDEEIAGMSAQDFIEAMTGPEGSEVEFTIGWAADTGTAVETLKLTRAFLDG